MLKQPKHFAYSKNHPNFATQTKMRQPASLESGTKPERKKSTLKKAIKREVTAFALDANYIKTLHCLGGAFFCKCSK